MELQQTTDNGTLTYGKVRSVLEERGLPVKRFSELSYCAANCGHRFTPKEEVAVVELRCGPMIIVRLVCAAHQNHPDVCKVYRELSDDGLMREMCLAVGLKAPNPKNGQAEAENGSIEQNRRKTSRRTRRHFRPSTRRRSSPVPR